PHAQTFLLELGGLVVHERDQRTHHNRRPAPRNRRKLIAETLAGAGGHDQQHVAPLGNGAANRLLILAKTRKPERVTQQGNKVHGKLYCPLTAPPSRCGNTVRNHQGDQKGTKASTATPLQPRLENPAAEQLIRGQITNGTRHSLKWGINCSRRLHSEDRGYSGRQSATFGQSHPEFRSLEGGRCS